MQRAAIILACFFVCTNTLAQQYPFVHYTPKDGLISTNVRNIYQDSKGRLYFASMNGLSVYDGARFSNYTSANGLHHDIVNCVMEMDNSSLWVVTNNGKIQSLANGKLKSIVFDSPPPVIDNLIRDEKGSLYAASEQGIFVFRKNSFTKLSFLGIRNSKEYVSNICPAGNYLLIVRDNSLLDSREKHVLYLYDPVSEKIIAETQKELIRHIAKAPDGRIWVSTHNKILAVDTINLKKGKLSFHELPRPYDKIITNGLSFFNFDQYGNCWMTDKVFMLKKVTPDGNEMSFSRESGLITMDISHVFQDKEGTTWIASFGEGVYKLVNSNLSFSRNISGITALDKLSYIPERGQMFLYSPHNSKAILIEDNRTTRIFEVSEASKIPDIFITPKGIIGFSDNAIFEIIISGNRLYPKTVFTDSVDNQFVNPFIDYNGNAILCGKEYLTVIIDAKTIYRKKINYFADQATMDKKGNIWIATRSGELIMYTPRAGDPTNYLSNETFVTKKIPDISPRSITIDKSDNIWIGSRADGIHIFKIENSGLTRKFSLTTATGLSDNFVTQLTCDGDNNIWVCTPSGLDKITLKAGIPIVENLTRQNNIYQKVDEVVMDKSDNAWVLTSNGIIKIAKENKRAINYSPTLMVSLVKTGKDTLQNQSGASLSPKQNTLSFYFAATSFVDEKQVLYSYRLQGGSNTDWSEPSNNSSVSFIDLPSGDYTLDIKAIFPAGRYPEQLVHYKFLITPAWWQTWWFRITAGLLIIGLLVVGFRFYYTRKLEKEKAVLEKQQAIEKERTRIATDMHDDFGAGLSRIKFLSQALSNRTTTDDSIKTGLEKITVYSDEMTEKMGEIVWALNEKNDTIADLVAYTRSYALEYLAHHNIHCNASTPTHLPGTFIPGEIRRNIFLAVKESLHNVIKHAQATTVNFSIELNGTIEIIIHDNGRGINWSGQRKFSNGLINIKKRLEEIKGKAEFINEQGTKVVLQAPLDL
jgi:ligand-binding sensor domain-containing protein